MGTRHTIELLEETFQKLMNRVHHRGLQVLLRESFTSEVMVRFRRWPAAVRHHGAVVGGLLEHTVNVTYIAEKLTQLYLCNQELVLAGALLHDIGKLEELEEQIGMGFTAAGNLFGHIILGAQYVQDRARQVHELDVATCQDLLHIMLAHHGTKEYGSPVCPATIEALIVHQADTAEAKLTGTMALARASHGVSTPVVSVLGFNPCISTSGLGKRMSEEYLEQLNRVRVPKRRAWGKNTTVFARCG